MNIVTDAVTAIEGSFTGWTREMMMEFIISPTINITMMMENENEFSDDGK